MVRKVDPYGRLSNQEGGYVYNPYRNPDAQSNVFLRKIKIDRVGDVEGWIAGKPEFYVTTLTISD
jgi:hypothetical protein